ncbi:uncharacterized protein isoform X2 [Choristoneura fumiferana]|uniref:uncharacterized protein isoform X2 n=1 Tax=Choristoneura fumiferana TaxID=7141 RepID=UPI003D1549B7
MMLELLWIFLLQFDNCIPNGVEPKKNLINNILRNNGESLKQLASKFPNHIIEMQVEMVDPTPEPPKNSLSSIRRYLKFNKKPSAHIAKTNLGIVLRKHPMKLPRSIVRSNDNNETGATNLSPTTAATEHGTDPDNRPVYMSDLKEAVEALEKKLIKSTPGDAAAPNTNNNENTIDDGNHPLLKKDLWEILDIAAQHRSTPPNYFKKLSGGTQAPQEYEAAIEAIDNNNPSGIKSIGDVISLVKKGVKVQFDITRPTDRNLDWIQIKVPNA